MVTPGIFALRGVDELILGTEAAPKTVYPKEPQAGSAQGNPAMGSVFINPAYPRAED